jgi:hypothetical protein
VNPQSPAFALLTGRATPAEVAEPGGSAGVMCMACFDRCLARQSRPNKQIKW